MKVRLVVGGRSRFVANLGELGWFTVEIDRHLLNLTNLNSVCPFSQRVIGTI
jgi:hypothetical protein